MTSRERFLATVRGGPRDRVPLIDLGYWDETLERWRNEGLPRAINQKTVAGHFNLDPFWRTYLSPEATDGHGLADRGMLVPGGLRVGLVPLFPESVVQDLGDQEIVRQGDGTCIRRHKTGSSIPLHESTLLKNRADWETHYLPRLDGTSADRYPREWQAFDRVANDPLREHILILPGGSLYGWLRNWIGMEDLSYLFYDDPVLVEEMIETITVCIETVLARTLARGGRFDACLFWEDLAYNAGPLISPDLFCKWIAPRYRRLTGLLRRHGVDLIIVDSDGRLDEILPLWLDAGVNGILPFEIGTTGADPVDYRKRFGPDLVMVGGFDKRILAGPRDGIVREIDRLRPLVESGGFIPCCDHKVDPGVSLYNYRFYLDTARERWSF